ncbi:MAG: Ezrin/radixin/moesin family protein [Cytophagales bacterium]|nr:Ezrin/radixin/moesin family protein [Cytophagales bacterium]MDW8384145.1 Ezrin/radixin/moesin family protein [Flammeovirgaceae bacterium]
MKIQQYAFLLLAVCLFATQEVAYAQKKKEKGSGMSKSEIKQWEKKKKEMTAEKFKEMYEDYNTMKGESAGLKRQIEALQRQASNNEALLAAKDQEIASLKEELEKAKAEAAAATTSKPTSNCDDYTKGLVYKVQVGAFRNKDLAKFQNRGNFWMEDADGIKKYTIGFFREYWEADEFKKYLREMGVKDAWIVAYENNQRRDIKEVLESGNKKK